MIINVAGTARNCGDGLHDRLLSLETFLSDSVGATVFWHLFENDSSDQTRSELQAFSRSRPNSFLHFEDGLTGRLPCREVRLAHCRNRLLDSVSAVVDADCSAEDDALYFPIDLDLEIPWPSTLPSFLSACKLVLDGTCTGVFPSSFPSYYDIHALRARGWNEHDAWHSLEKARKWKRVASRERLRERFIYSKQIAAETLQSKGDLYWVTSAFGGFGIYRFAAVRGFRYESDALDACEHVSFNRNLDKLAIMPSLCIPAPMEHLGARSSATQSLSDKVRRIFRLRAK